MRELSAPIGWPLLGGPDGAGQWHWPSLERSVADGLRALLSTRPRELLAHADYGAGLQEFLHQANTLAVRARMQQRIEAAVARYEPRVQLDRVDLRELPDDASALRIELHYRLRRTGQAQQMALALSLGG
jgi:uncharacterized protein